MNFFGIKDDYVIKFYKEQDMLYLINKFYRLRIYVVIIKL